MPSLKRYIEVLKTKPMKKIYWIAAFMAVVAIACSKRQDVPSLHEQMEGSWQVRSYTEERYDILNNTVSRNEVICNGSATMNFSAFEKLYVNFDTAAAAVWTYKVVNHRTLEIENKKWTITKLDPKSFHLSLNERDSSLKHRDVVGYRLERP